MKKILLISTFALGLGFTSCDSFMDINENPNSPAEGQLDAGMMLPAAEMNIASSYGDYLRTVGGYYAEIYAHLNGTSNYVDYSQFSQSATRCSSTYSQLYQRSLNTLKTVMKKAEASEEWGTYLAATTLRAFTYQVLVDCWGETPYTEALSEEFTSPKYDDGLTIYQGILAELDEALAKVSDDDVVCTSFLLPNKFAGSWVRVANALKLRMLMRMSGVQDVKSQLAALVQANKFPTEDVAFEGCWSDESDKRSPFYGSEFSPGVQNNVAANLALVGTMQTEDYTDPRLSAYFTANKDGKYIGSVSGTNYPSSSSLTSWCRPVASYNMPVVLISEAETWFFLAEYYARYGSSTDAEQAYNKAIEVSFANAGVEGSEDYLATYPYEQGRYAEVIGVAKWVHLSGVNPFEAWCELRRLDYPAFSNQTGEDFYTVGDDGSFNTSSYLPGTLYTPIQVFGQVGAKKLLERFPYAESSSARNENVPDFPGYTTPVFWGK